jgi:hypothetical protein
MRAGWERPRVLEVRENGYLQHRQALGNGDLRFKSKGSATNLEIAHANC